MIKEPGLYPENLIKTSTPELIPDIFKAFRNLPPWGKILNVFCLFSHEYPCNGFYQKTCFVALIVLSGFQDAEFRLVGNWMTQLKTQPVALPFLTTTELQRLITVGMKR